MYDRLIATRNTVKKRPWVRWLVGRDEKLVRGLSMCSKQGGLVRMYDTCSPLQNVASF